MDALYSIIANLGFDSTFLPLFALMFVLYLFLSNLYLKPYQHLLHHRKEKTEGTKKEAQALAAKADDKYSLYRSRIKETNDKIQKIFKESEELAKKEESKIMSDALSKSKDILQSAQQQLESEKKSALESLSKEIPMIASEIATKALGRAVNAR